MTGIVSHMDLLCSVSGCLLYKTQKKPFKIAFIASINLDVCFTKTFYFALIDTVGPMLILLTDYSRKYLFLYGNQCQSLCRCLRTCLASISCFKHLFDLFWLPKATSYLNQTSNNNAHHIVEK